MSTVRYSFLAIALVMSYFGIAQGQVMNTDFTQVSPFPLRVVRESWKQPIWPWTMRFRYHMEWRPQVHGNSPVAFYRIEQGVQGVGFQWLFSRPIVVNSRVTTYLNSAWLFSTGRPGRRIFRVIAIRQNGREFVVGEAIVEDPI